MNEYLIDIIERMCDTSSQIMETGHNSSESISWKAYREAERVSDIDFIPQLMLFIDKEKDKKKRDKACFLLGHIAKNTNSRLALTYLIQRVNKESNKYIISSLLDRISDLQKPPGTDLEPLIKMTKSDKWLIRHSAIKSLNHSSDSVAEAALIEIIDVSNDPYNLIYSNATLNRIGTARAIPYLEKHLKSRKRDVKLSAQYAIEEIKKRSG